MVNRQNEYFNEKDYYLIYLKSIDKSFVSRVHFYNGNWYSNESLQVKMTSVKSIEINELYKKLGL